MKITPKDLIKKYVVAYKLYIYILKMFDVSTPAVTDFSSHGFIIHDERLAGTINWSVTDESLIGNLNMYIRYQNSIQYNQVFENYTKGMAIIKLRTLKKEFGL